MIEGKHCDLCKHSKRDLKIGLTCGLTNKKPTFQKTCPSIKFSISFKKNLSELLDKIEQLRKQKILIYLNLFLFLGAGFIMIIGTYSKLKTKFIGTFEPEFDYGNWKYFLVMLSLNFIAIQLIYLGLWRFYKYRKELKKLKLDIKEINTVLKNYDINIKSLIDKKAA